MNDNTFQKLDIALEHLAVALRLYYETEEYFSALHLAGAAEELLGAYATAVGEKSALAHIVEDTDLISRKYFGKESNKKNVIYLENFAKNHTKHMNDVNDSSVGFSPKEEAEALIDRAITNYFTLLNLLSMKIIPNMDRYLNEPR